MFILKFFRFILKLLAKLFLLPVLLVVVTIQMMANILLYIGGIGVSVCICIGLLFIIITIVEKKWESTAFFGVLSVLIVGVLFLAGAVVVLLESMTDAIVRFMAS